MTINTRLMNEGAVVRELSVDYTIPATLPEMVKKYGEDIVVAQATDAITIALQAFIRTKFKAKERLSDKQITDAVATWKPGMRKTVSPEVKRENIKKVFDTLPENEKKELIKLLRGTK